MPFQQQNLAMLKEWIPDPHRFDQANDRLLATTNWGDHFLLMWSEATGEHGKLMFDPTCMPANLSEISRELNVWHRIRAIDDDGRWYVYIYDGELTASGHQIEIEAMGPGWTWKIHTSLGIECIVPVGLDVLNTQLLRKPLGGIYIQPGNLRVLESAVRI